MPKKRQIPFLFEQKLADGRSVWHWKPSKRLRVAGFTNQKLGNDHAQAVAQAVQLNAQVAAWQGSGDDRPNTLAPRIAPPRIVRFGELVDRYQRSEEWANLKKNTQREYGTRLRQLEHWAQDGMLAVRSIDKALVRDLRAALMKQSTYKTGAVLRVLRMLLNWAMSENIVSQNATAKVTIPEPPARRTMMGPHIREAIREAAVELDLFDVALAIDLAFWTLQRQGDVMGMGRMAWRQITPPPDADPRHVAQLVDARGRMMGFRLIQQKTGTEIDAPMPPMLHAEVTAAMRRGGFGWVFPHPEKPEQPMPTWMFQRRFRAARDAASAVAIMREQPELAEAIDEVQYRDLRRTGMVFYRDAGAQTEWVTALSGHAVIGKKTILDVYMPGNTPAAIACVATGLRHMERIREQEALG
ncbi:hypothetical protein S2M10_29740 [Sphingomonas sp. S2M10]|uniref:phage integrase SAM-like domain-containing protein n=1 Tax=Sphingomonas sp. S2M10 TaxID=2705010 RepID=UPI0014572DAA|nr:phage integrase SAM-like domain-containing protein [Sphingomonas sp. S2M10]NLS27972.1 hypothetical protein [Sphingomonas sp. S2M10]